MPDEGIESALRTQTNGVMAFTLDRVQVSRGRRLVSEIDNVRSTAINDDRYVSDVFPMVGRRVPIEFRSLG
jgi:hypothetical protein